MTRVEALTARFGGQSELARLLDTNQSTVQYWVSNGRISAKWHSKIIKAGKEIGLLVDPLELQPRRNTTKATADSEVNSLSSPFAKWRGKIDLGGDELDVYVLDTADRVISLRSAVKSIADADSGDLAKFIGVS